MKRTEMLLGNAVDWVSAHCPTDYDFVLALKHIGFTDTEIKEQMDIDWSSMTEEERMELQRCV